MMTQGLISRLVFKNCLKHVCPRSSRPRLSGAGAGLCRISNARPVFTCTGHSPTCLSAGTPQPHHPQVGPQRHTPLASRSHHFFKVQKAKGTLRLPGSHRDGRGGDEEGKAIREKGVFAGNPSPQQRLLSIALFTSALCSPQDRLLPGTPGRTQWDKGIRVTPGVGSTDLSGQRSSCPPASPPAASGLCTPERGRRETPSR